MMRTGTEAMAVGMEEGRRIETTLVIHGSAHL